MACGATLSLKRSLEFDPLYSPGQHSPKRRRCVPMSLSSATPQPKTLKAPSPFADAAPKLSSGKLLSKSPLHIFTTFRILKIILIDHVNG